MMRKELYDVIRVPTCLCILYLIASVLSCITQPAWHPVCVCVCLFSPALTLLRGQSSLEQPSNYGGHGVTVEMRENGNWIMTRQGWNLSLDTSKDSHTCTLGCAHTNAHTHGFATNL